MSDGFAGSVRHLACRPPVRTAPASGIRHPTPPWPRFVPPCTRHPARAGAPGGAWRVGPGSSDGQTGTVTSRTFDLARVGAGLSFAAAVDDVERALDASTALVISAPPGTGNTTW